MTIATSTPSLFDLYFDYVRDTEPPVIFHRWSLLSSLGALLGRQVWIPFGSFRIFPNQFVMLIAEPGARKSTAIKTARKLLSKAGYDKFAAEKTSKEKFLLDLEGVEESSDSQVSEKLVMENLLGSVLGSEPRKPTLLRMSSMTSCAAVTSNSTQCLGRCGTGTMKAPRTSSD